MEDSRAARRGSIIVSTYHQYRGLRDESSQVDGIEVTGRGRIGRWFPSTCWLEAPSGAMGGGARYDNGQLKSRTRRHEMGSRCDQERHDRVTCAGRRLEGHRWER